MYSATLLHPFEIRWPFFLLTRPSPFSLSLPPIRRNADSYNHYDLLYKDLQKDRINYVNLLFFSLAFRRLESGKSDLYKTQIFSYHRWCKTARARFLDIGFLGKFYFVDDMLKDYDVNFDSW